MRYLLLTCISPVKGKTIISNITNISKQPYVIDQLTIGNLKWEPCDDNVYFSNALTRTIR